MPLLKDMFTTGPKGREWNTADLTMPIPTYFVKLESGVVIEAIHDGSHWMTQDYKILTSVSKWRPAAVLVVNKP